MSNNEDFLIRLKQIFQVEAEENLETISIEILNLEKNIENKESIETILRQVHSLKGSARSVSITEIVHICQSLESVFVKLKNNHLEIPDTFFNTIHQSINMLKKILDDTDKKQSIYPVIKDLNQLLSNKKTKAISLEAPVNQIFISDDSSSLTIPRAELSELRIEQKNAFINISNINKNASQVTESEVINKNPLISSDILKNKSIVIDSETNTEIEAKLVSVKKSETIRIETSKLDKLLIQSEDMLSIKLNSDEQFKVINNTKDQLDDYFNEQNKIYSEVKKMLQDFKNKDTASFYRINEIIENTSRKEKLLKDTFNNLIEQTEQSKDEINSKVNDLLKEVKMTLMFPFSSILSAFPLMVRDISKTLSKDVELTITGSEIEIDKRILEEIKDPLIHLLRNSIDHGLESTENRKNKSTQGNIKIDIQQTDNNKIEIRIYDDGKGLNLHKIKEKLINLHIFNKYDADKLSPDEIKSYIFQSGFSTSAIITEISGRGLGLAIVKEKIDKIGGSITVNSEYGEYTQFIISLPLTLSTFRGLLVKSSDKQFVIPVNNIEKVIRINKNNTKTINGKIIINFDDRVLSCFYLSDILKIAYSQLPKTQDYIQIVIISTLGKNIGLWVDEVLYEQEVMVKSLGKQLVRIKNISGLTLLGSGQNVPLLNIRDIFKSVTLEKYINLEVNQTVKEEKKQKVLIAEDSITSRTLLTNILESAGYDVTAVVDGLIAYQTLENETFDILISDVEMPRMDGFDLTTKVRANKKTANLPVILITSLNSKEHKEKGIEVGANAYIVKSELEQENLLNIIPRLI